MAARDERIFYAGTINGLYLLESNGGELKPRLLGLQSKGRIMAPVVVDKDNPKRLFAATTLCGLFRSDDGGKSWREIDDGIIYKEIWSLAQHKKTGELFAGTGPSSIFRSMDGGEHWQDCEQLKSLPETIDWTFPRPPHVSHVKHIGLCDDDPLTIMGAVEEGWIVCSRDGGNHWTNVKDDISIDAHTVNIMPDNPEVVVATAGEGAYRSTDGGASFAKSMKGLDRRYLAPLVVHPSRPNVLFTGASAVPPPGWSRPEGADSGFYRSEDQGLSWQRLSGGLPEHFKAAPRGVAGDPEDPNSYFVGMTDGSVWGSEDGGESFRQLIGGLPHITSLKVARR